MRRVTVGIGLVFTALLQGCKARSPDKVETAVMSQGEASDPCP